MKRQPPKSTLFPYTPLFGSGGGGGGGGGGMQSTEVMWMQKDDVS